MPENSTSFWIKIAAGTFVTVVAPVLAAIVIKYTDAILPPAAPGPDAAATDKASGASKSSDATAKLQLFNGRDLTNFYSWLGPPHGKETPLGKNRDLKQVFTVKDGILRISGEVYGGLITEREYENYHLVVEYRWGEKTWGPREKSARSSGVCVHCIGPEGAASGLWMQSIRCSFMEGVAGNFALFNPDSEHKITISVEGELRTGTVDGKPQSKFYHQPGLPLTTFSSGIVHRLRTDPNWKNVKGFHSKKETLEKPLGQWNTLEVICLEDTIENRLNGETVNTASEVNVRKGKILLMSDGAEIFIRKLELTPLQ